MQLLPTGLTPPIFGHVIKLAIAEGEDNGPEFKDAAMLGMELAYQSDIACEAAKHRALEIAPALLALADWPLDNHDPVECSRKQYALADTLDDAQINDFETSSAQSNISEIAMVSGEPLPIAKQSSSQLALANPYPHPLDPQMGALDIDTLDEIRGGFELEGSGLKFSIGIERAVFINGNLVATTVLVPKDLQPASSAGSLTSVLPGASTSTLGIIQNGAGNNVNTQQIGQNVTGTVIQNTLNDQKIQNVTTINATVNSMQTLRTMSLQNSIQTGIISSLRR